MTDSSETAEFGGADFLRFAGPIFFLGLQMSSVRTALQIIDTRTVGNLSIIPFASLLVNCIIWTFYGFLKGDYTVLLPNLLGVFAGGFCFRIFKFYSGTNDPSVNYTVLVLISIAGYFFAFNKLELLGYFGCILAVLLMGSPLATLSTVVREQSTNAMPFTTSLLTWGNAFSWSLYGLVIADDKMIYGPNLLGLGLASIQMILYLIYGLPQDMSESLPIRKN